MLLRTIGPSTSEPTGQHAQMADVIDVELLPPVRGTALTLAADLKSEQTLDATSDTVIVRLDNSCSSGFIDELNEIPVHDRADEIVIHGFTPPSVIPGRSIVVSRNLMPISKLEPML